MLQKLNERIQGVVAWLVIILIAITFTLFGVDYYLQSHQTSSAKLVINDQPVTNQAFESSYRRNRAQQDIAHMSAQDEKNLQNQVVNQMITNEVSMQAAKKYGFEVSSEQANSAIVSIPQFQEDGHFSSSRYQQALSGALFTPESFQSEVKQGMLLNQQRFSFIGSSFALPNEIQRFVKLYMQTRDYDYLIIPAASFLPKIQVTDADIKAYFAQHEKSFMSPEQVAVDYLVLSVTDLKSQMTVSKEEIKSYYDENRNSYMTPAQWQAAHILFAIPENASAEEAEKIRQKAETTYTALQQKPEQFDSLVASVSDDKLSVADKGVLPWISAGQSEYAKALSQLTRPGQISMPEKTAHGYEIFKLVAYKPAVVQPLSAVEATISAQLLADKAQTKYTQALEQLTDLTYQTPDSLTPAADALQLKVSTSEPFARAGGASALTKNQLVVNAAFSHDVLELGNNSEPLQLDNDSVVVIRVNKHVPARNQTLAEVKDKIQSVLAQQAAESRAKQLGASLLLPAEDKQQQALLAANQLTWKSVEHASRDNDKAAALINDVAFNLLRPENRNGVTLENGDYALVRLKHINDGDLSSLDKEQRDSLVQQIEASYGMMDYELYVNGLVKKAVIVRN